jgi:biotin carboxyl carrier protein
MGYDFTGQGGTPQAMFMSPWGFVPTAHPSMAFAPQAGFPFGMQPHQMQQQMQQQQFQQQQMQQQQQVRQQQAPASTTTTPPKSEPQQSSAPSQKPGEASNPLDIFVRAAEAVSAPAVATVSGASSISAQ